MVQITDEFPQPADRARINKQNIHEQFLESNYDGVVKYSYTNGKRVAEVKDTLVPIPYAISEISSDLLFGEFPKIEIADDESTSEEFNDWSFSEGLQSDMLEVGVYTSALGTVFARFFRKDDIVYYDFVKGNRVIWEEDYKGITDVKFIESSVRDKQGNIIYTIQEWFMDGEQLVIQHYKIKVTGDTFKVKEVYDVEEDRPEGIDFIPVVKILNIGQMGKVSGKSDYDGKEQLFTEIDNRIDQNNNVLEENADPWILMPTGVLDNKGKFNKSQGKMIEKISGGQTDNGVDVVTWNASLDAAFTQIKTMVKMVFFTARISDPISGLDNGGQADSGRALRWRSINTLAMIRRKRKYFDTFFRTFVDYWARLSGETIEQRKDIKVFWQDGLPMDETEVIENTVKQVNAGILSHLSAIQKVNEISKDDAEKELDQVASEQQAIAQTQAQAMGPITI